MPKVNPKLKTIYRKQKTLAKEAFFSGIGIHTGAQVSMRFIPADKNTGIAFRRTDLSSQPLIPANLSQVCDTARSTTIAVKEVRVHTVEHVLAALRAYEIDNLIIEVSNVEPPVANGSSDVFVDLIEEAGVVEQDGHMPIIKLDEPIWFCDGDKQIVAVPHDEYRISYTLNYPECKALQSQFYTCSLSSHTFKDEIAPCRTFSLYDEVSTLMDRGLIRGGSLDNAVIIKDSVIFSKGGLFFPNEMVRHKVLDLIGDLSLIGWNFLAHIIAIRSGHETNFSFAKKLHHYISAEAN